MESVQLEHENVTKLVLVTLRDGVEEGRGFSNAKKDPMTSKELNEEPYEVKISCVRHELKKEVVLRAFVPEIDQSTILVPALQSEWLIMHSFSSGEIHYINERGNVFRNTSFFSANNYYRSQLIQQLDYWSYRVISLGFIFLTIGILSGAVWANEAWGSYWNWDPMDEDMVSLDPIEFHSEEEPYKDRIDSYQRKTGLTEAVQTGIGQLNGIPVAIGVMDFQFMGGSMGSVVGEKITRLIEYATNKFLPLIIERFSPSRRRSTKMNKTWKREIDYLNPDFLNGVNSRLQFVAVRWRVAVRRPPCESIGEQLQSSVGCHSRRVASSVVTGSKCIYEAVAFPARLVAVTPNIKFAKHDSSRWARRRLGVDQANWAVQAFLT
ncbi:hypothetical protein RJ640_012558 [Escallonia rubra]|uniref:CoA carboxyltransferase N-terminal domain-containing protein n=1 Tax=Escallonia rubra TaxID=112253 RepID=A0AA88TYZ2_9ASTE|nr:hypothetical protein RJ640_012558 [Escallonia rubra]